MLKKAIKLTAAILANALVITTVPVDMFQNTKENNNESHHWKECACGERNADTVEAHTDESKNHECDACGRVVSTCEDNNFNHECDTCGVAMGTHEAGVGTHVCDWCGQSASTCEDTDGNCICDWCGQGVEHSHSTDWEKDDEKHWHECKCGDKADEQAHAFGEWNSENIRTCTDCGFEQTRPQPNDSSSEGDSSIGGESGPSSGSEGNFSDGESGQGGNGESTSVSQPTGSAPWGVIALVAVGVAGAAVVVVIILRKFKR